MDQLKNFFKKFSHYYFIDDINKKNRGLDGLISQQNGFFQLFSDFIFTRLQKGNSYDSDYIANFIRELTELFSIEENVECHYIILFFHYLKYYASEVTLNKSPNDQINDFYENFVYSESDDSFYISLKNNFKRLIRKISLQQQRNIIISDYNDTFMQLVLTVIMFNAYISCFDLFDVVDKDIDIDSDAEYFSVRLYCGCFSDINSSMRIKEFVLGES